jgi:tetratricopeptide (TPR) repeat protein
MPRLRQPSLHGLTDAFCQATMAWTLQSPEDSLHDYIERHGVAHLLGRDRKDAAEARMLDLHFMTAFGAAWPTIVEPLKAWRLVGLDRARVGYMRIARALGPAEEGDQETAWFVGKVSRWLDSAGLYAPGRAFAAWEQAVCERALGDDHEGTLASLDNLAHFYKGEGRLSEAEPLFLRVLEARERLHGSEHPGTIHSVQSLASLYEAQERYEEAEGLYSHALEVIERHLGPDHIDTLCAVGNLAMLYESQGRYAEAEPLCLRDLETAERTLGPDHRHTQHSVHNLALLYEAQGRYAEAERLHVRALTYDEEQLGPEHPSTLTSANNLAILYKLMGRLADAESLYRRNREALVRTIGLGHPKTVTCLNNLAWVQLEQGRPAAREDFLACQAALPADDHWKRRWMNLGIALCDALKTGDFAGAEAVIGDLVDLLGEGHNRVEKAHERVAMVRALRDTD